MENSNISVEDKNSNSLQFLKIVLDCLPYPMFIKNASGNYLLVNNKQAQVLGFEEAFIIGKSDAYFIKDQTEYKYIVETDTKVFAENRVVELPVQKFTLENDAHVFKTFKIPFANPFTNDRLLLGYSMDVTDTFQLEHLKSIVTMCSNPFM
jgi:PAS domain-containing protein